MGATLFIGNLDPDVDEKLLYDTFSAFGMIVNTPKISRDPESGLSKSFGFVSFDNFESSDAAIEAMDGQYLMNKQISVSYAFKKDGKGEKHGSAAERLLAAEGKKNVQLPNRLFSGGPALAPAIGTGPTATAVPTPAFPVNGAVPGFRPPPPPPPMGYPPAPPAGSYPGYW